MNNNFFSKLISAFCLGISCSIFISILYSFLENTGNYYPVPPLLIKNFGNELNAMLIQTLTSGFYGIFWFIIGNIYRKRSLSLLKATILHFIMGLLISIPIALLLNWTNMKLSSLLGFILIFTIIYALIWTFNYLFNKRKIKQLNDKLKKFNEDK